MIEEIAWVRKVDGEHVWVETQVKTTCGSCNAKENCGTSTIAKYFTPKIELLRVKTPIALKEGQRVKLGIPEEALLKASMMVYLVPLSTFMVFIILIQALFNVHELVAMVGAIFSALGSSWWVAVKAKGKHKYHFTPIIMGAVNDNQIIPKHEIPSKKL